MLEKINEPFKSFALTGDSPGMCFYLLQYYAVKTVNHFILKILPKKSVKLEHLIFPEKSDFQVQNQLLTQIFWPNLFHFVQYMFQDRKLYDIFYDFIFV